MTAKVIGKGNGKFELTIEFEAHGNMLAIEDQLQNELNEGGRLVMREALSEFDTDGSPIMCGDVKFTSRGMFNKNYQTSFGVAEIQRHVYQSSKGGKTFCPLEEKACIELNATPRYAKIVSGKYANMGAGQVVEDLLECNGRKISIEYVRKLGHHFADVAMAKEDVWEYATPELEREVTTVSISIDGANMPIKDDGFREAMCGTISMYDEAGERLHTIYVGQAPESGKGEFKRRFSNEIEKIKTLFPEAHYIGLADGAKDNWTFLGEYVDDQLLDFFHASEYVGDAAAAIFCGNDKKRLEFIVKSLHNLKHKKGAAKRLLNEIQEYGDSKKRLASLRDQLDACITYFTNNYDKMQYYKFTKADKPIGSGVVEAACKTLVKQRLCASGMRWKKTGANHVLKLRSLKMTKGRWQQFWDYVGRFGASL